MICSPVIRQRCSIRLQGYDYSQAGLYFITICCQNRLNLFGEIKNHEMILNNAGEMIKCQWLELINRFNNITLHEFVVMPNHFHGIIESVTIEQIVGVPLVGTLKTRDQQPIMGQPQGIAPTLGDMVGAFKSLTTDEYIRNIKQNKWQPFSGKLWQRNYYEHIIRDEQSYLKTSEYIINNPMNWEKDDYYA